MKKKPSAYSLSPEVIQELRNYSNRLSLKLGRSVSASAVVEKVLRKFLKLRGKK